MLQFRMLACAATAAALLTAMPAAAIVKIATYTGIVLNGYDYTGVFGTANTDLAGRAFTSTYIYDRSLGGHTETDATHDLSYGGESFALPGADPIIVSTLTINGVTRTVSGTAVGYAYTSAGLVDHEASDYFQDTKISILHAVYTYAYTVGAPASLDQNFGPSATLFAPATGGTFLFATQVLANGSYTERASGFFKFDKVYSVTNYPIDDPVPEPSTWALMIAGFGLVGAALRRRERLAAA